MFRLPRMWHGQRPCVKGFGMAKTHEYRRRRNILAAWLRDRFGPDDDSPDAMFWPDAADLLKFLAGNGYAIRRGEEDDPQ